MNSIQYFTSAVAGLTPGAASSTMSGSPQSDSNANTVSPSAELFTSTTIDGEQPAEVVGLTSGLEQTFTETAAFENVLSLHSGVVEAGDSASELAPEQPAVGNNDDLATKSGQARAGIVATGSSIYSSNNAPGDPNQLRTSFPSKSNPLTLKPGFTKANPLTVKPKFTKSNPLPFQGYFQGQRPVVESTGTGQSGTTSTTGTTVDFDALQLSPDRQKGLTLSALEIGVPTNSTARATSVVAATSTVRRNGPVASELESPEHIEQRVSTSNALGSTSELVPDGSASEFNNRLLFQLNTSEPPQEMPLGLEIEQSAGDAGKHKASTPTAASLPNTQISTVAGPVSDGLKALSTPAGFGTPAQQVVVSLEKQILRAGNLESKSLSVELNPAELGQLKIRVEQVADQITAHIVASEVVSAELLMQEKDFLLNSLSELGFDEASVDISYGNENNEDAREALRQNPGGDTDNAAGRDFSGQGSEESVSLNVETKGINFIA